MSESPHSSQVPEIIIFDCFGVLLDFDDQLLFSRLAPHCQRLPHDFDTHLVLTAKELVTGRQTLAELHSVLAESVGLKLSYENFASAWRQPYSWPVQGMEGLVRSLAQNYRVALLSNIDFDYWKAVAPDQLHLAYFEKLLLSFELGLSKPDPAIFELACAVMEARPDSCFFIDDTLANVEAARSFGLQSHWFRGLASLREALADAGIRIS